MLIDPEVVGCEVLGDVHIEPAVLIEVVHHALVVPEHSLANTTRLTHVGERTVAVVEKQMGFPPPLGYEQIEIPIVCQVAGT